MSRYALDDAAAEALWPHRSAREEFIGLLYSSGGEVLATEGQTRGAAAKASGRFAIPRGSLRGVFHNHPERRRARQDLRSNSRDDERARFSRNDIEEAERLRVPSYISAGPALLRYTPGEPGDGEPVLAAVPIDAIRAELMRKILDRAPDDPRGLKR